MMEATPLLLEEENRLIAPLPFDRWQPNIMHHTPINNHFKTDCQDPQAHPNSVLKIHCMNIRANFHDHLLHSSSHMADVIWIID